MNPNAHESRGLDHTTLIGELADVLRRPVQTTILIVGVLVLLFALKLVIGQAAGWLSLLCIGAGTCLALGVWQSAGRGLPLLPLLAIQHVTLYGIPLVTRGETVTGYPDGLIERVGFEVLTLLASCALAWRVGMQMFHPRKPAAYSLRAFAGSDNRVLNRVGIAMILVAGGYELLKFVGLLGPALSVLPEGANSIVVAVVNAVAMSGYFLVAMMVSSGEARSFTRTAFWGVLFTHSILLTSSLLLSSIINVVGAVTLGLFWGSRRFPTRYLLICVAALSFLNLGKFDMRARYWGNLDERPDDVSASVDLASLPRFYFEWVGFSADSLLGNENNRAAARDSQRQSMLARMDNLQNLLFVADAVTDQNMPVLQGATYSIIPPLLVPRVLWPDKPRTHEGQVMLNVHFGRQSRDASFGTYIAWGLLPEAYGNFGPLAGALVLGCVLGFVFAWIENFTANKPLLSMEGMVAFVLFIGFAASYEMVASVLVTSLFQSALTVAMACAPFVQRTLGTTPDQAPAAE